MKNLIIRGITGLMYVLLTVGSIFISKYTFCVFFAAVLGYTLYEFYRMSKQAGNRPQILVGILISLVLFISFFLYDHRILNKTVFFLIIPALLLIPITEIFRKSNQPVNNIAITILGIVYIGLPFIVLNLILTPYINQPDIYYPEVLLGLFILLWANDTGAYLVGSRLGKHKMFERISPNKSWEGAIGGAVLAIIVGILLFNHLDILSPLQAIVLSLICVISGNIGDFTESMFKRNFNVKDTGKILPGHGGLLDRFDSMLFAAPLYYIYISLIIN